MLKILYAADNRKSSYYNLKSFLSAYQDFYEIKVAAYSKSIQDLNVDWTLDALLDFRNKWLSINTNNSNFKLYTREIKSFKPDVIISDLEIYSSYIGLNLQIPVWQVSPFLLYYGINHTHNLYKYFAGLFAKNQNRQQYLSHILHNSDKKLILSHLGDFDYQFNIVPGYEWARPNYDYKEDRYSIGLANAYYKGLPVKQPVDFSDPESIVANYYNTYSGLDKPFEPKINQNIKFLSQHLEQIDI